MNTAPSSTLQFTSTTTSDRIAERAFTLGDLSGRSRYRRNEKADLAAGYGRVLVLSPFGGRSRMPVAWGMHLAAQVDELRARGSSVETIFPDSSSGGAFGVNMMDPSTRAPAARAGHRQGMALAEQLSGFWR